ncbi:hypothetical protein AB2L27_04875 [Kineococcus sp. LSe6-4]|uniref:Fibronectin type-III domain-containing protein n=1 Tax=Kineococcus halophytocola TaxID=3234027 RepID=A0ABV4GXQ1_9ACTN
MNSLGARTPHRVLLAALAALVVALAVTVGPVTGRAAAATGTPTPTPTPTSSSSPAPTSSATAPAVSADPATVTADVLPTVQIDGVVWAQTTVGNTVYVTGRFTSARPAGAAAGTGETPRRNILAYDLVSGNLLTTFNASLNAEGLGITSSPDGSRIYVVGNFTQANGDNRYRIAALDARTGALVPGFNPQVDYRARAVVATGGTVYVGGQFSVANKTARSRLAAFSAATGALLPWAPAADNEVFGLVVPDSGSVVAAGRFTTLNGADHYGMGALDPVTGASRPWAATDVVRNGGADAAIYSLATDGTNVYGTGYQYKSSGEGNFEGSFAADGTTGRIRWVAGCTGDTYSVEPIGGVVYTVGHAHDCSPIGGWPQTEPWSYQRAVATTVEARGKNSKGTFAGKPSPGLLTWWPTLDVGTVTGQVQAAWSVTGNDRYVSLGGEFPKVNNVPQQGIVRMALRAHAPNLEGPRYQADFVPDLTSPAAGTVRVGWRTTWDPDNADLRYRIVRDGQTETPVGTVTARSTWWNRPTAEFLDTGLAPGSTHTYRIYADDADGNSTNSTLGTVTVGADPDPVPTTLAADSFSRTVSGGWGGASPGGSWSLAGGSSNFRVASGAGQMTSAWNRLTSATLGSVRGTGADVAVTTWADRPPANGGVVATAYGRRVDGDDDYRTSVRLKDGQAVSLTLTRKVAGKQTDLTSRTLPGLVASPGAKVRVRTQVTGTNPTVLKAKAWAAGTPEPADWQVSATDATPALQVPGSPALSAYLSSGAETTTVRTSWDDLVVTDGGQG